ncbi:hypothetical protein B0H11DRAFT_2063389 [Mycena galericulata]|nr:hypothetical protein B0H11DRAFT_2063389 [Mycena galericulata]
MSAPVSVPDVFPTRSLCSQCGSSVTFAHMAEESSCDFDDVQVGTRYHMLLNSNQTPLESDLDAINSGLSKTDAHLACLDAELLRLSARVAQLERERALLSEHRARNRAIISPLRRMPPEVLCEIFAWTLPTLPPPEATSRRWPTICDSPWVLTQICNRWRAIAAARPSLWSLVAINYSSPQLRPVSVVKIQLERAQKLRVHFYGSQNTGALPQIEMFALLSQYSARWEDLSLGLTSHLVPLLPALRDQLPLLSKVWIQWDGPQSQDSVESIECFHGAPALSDVGIHNEFRSVAIPFPAQHLTRYDLDGPWELNRGVLAFAPNLVEAHIQISFAHELQPTVAATPGDSEILAVRSLRRLFASHAEILDHLLAPTLDEIALHMDGTSSWDVAGAFPPFLARSGCSIQRFTLTGSPSAYAALTVLNRVSSSVTALVLIYDIDTDGDEDECAQAFDHLMSFLIVPDPDPNTAAATTTALGPHLSEIHVGCRNGTYIDHDLYLMMLQSRCRAGNLKCRLKAATLLTHLGMGPSGTTLDGLETLRRDGLDILLMEGRDALIGIKGWTYSSGWN